MIDYIKDIKKILKEDCQRATAEDSELCDGDKRSRMTVVVPLPEGGLIIRLLGKKAHMGGIIRDDKGNMISCDYMILIPQGDAMGVCFVEMKKTLNEANLITACNQILCTTPFLDYLVSMVKVHWWQTNQKIKINKHYIVIANKFAFRTDKQVVKIKSPQLREYKGQKFSVVQSIVIGQNKTMYALLPTGTV